MGRWRKKGMQRKYEYASQFLWNREAWDSKISPVQKIARWMGEEGLLYRTYTGEIHMPEDAEMDVRLGSYLSPGEKRFWLDQGMRLDFGNAGERWVTLVPWEVMAGQEHDPLTLFVLTDFCYTDDCWALKFTKYYRNLFEMAAKERMMLCFVNSVPSRVDLCILILREMAQRYNVNHSRLFMDVTAFTETGHRLSQVPGLKLKDADGSVLSDPDSAIVPFGSRHVPAIHIAGQWVSNDSLEFANFTPGRIGHLPFDFHRLKNSIAGKKMADAMRLEYDYDTGEDEGLQNTLRQMGLRYHYSEINNRGWVCIAPENASVAPEGSLPCMVILQEICKADPHSIPSALSLWYEYLNLAAMGELMLIFFVLEDVESNELLTEILEQASGQWPVLDKNRIFITGHSHNGHYASAFARRHPDWIAGVATMGNPHGLSLNRETVKLTEEEIAAWGRMEFAWINIDGQWENPFSCQELRPGDRKYLPEDERVTCYQNRVRAFRCPCRSAEEILGAAASPNKAARMLGVPTDRSWIINMDGDECYVGELLSRDRRNLLRLVTIENLPHATSCHMPWLSWNYLRNFSRDPRSGKILDERTMGEKKS